MKRILHIVTRPPDPWVEEFIRQQAADAALQIERVDLNGPEPDYDALVTRIFDADSIATW